MVSAKHSASATEQLSEQNVVTVKDVKAKREALEKILAEMQTKRQADEH